MKYSCNYNYDINLIFFHDLSKDKGPLERVQIIRAKQQYARFMCVCNLTYFQGAK